MYPTHHLEEFGYLPTFLPNSAAPSSQSQSQNHLSVSTANSRYSNSSLGSSTSSWSSSISGPSSSQVFWEEDAFSNGHTHDGSYNNCGGNEDWNFLSSSHRSNEAIAGSYGEYGSMNPWKLAISSGPMLDGDSGIFEQSSLFETGVPHHGRSDSIWVDDNSALGIGIGNPTASDGVPNLGIGIDPRVLDSTNSNNHPTSAIPIIPQFGNNDSSLSNSLLTKFDESFNNESFSKIFPPAAPTTTTANLQNFSLPVTNQSVFSVTNNVNVNNVSNVDVVNVSNESLSKDVLNQQKEENDKVNFSFDVGFGSGLDTSTNTTMLTNDVELESSSGIGFLTQNPNPNQSNFHPMGFQRIPPPTISPQHFQPRTIRNSASFISVDSSENENDSTSSPVKFPSPSPSSNSEEPEFGSWSSSGVLQGMGGLGLGGSSVESLVQNVGIGYPSDDQSPQRNQIRQLSSSTTHSSSINFPETNFSSIQQSQHTSNPSPQPQQPQQHLGAPFSFLDIDRSNSSDPDFPELHRTPSSTGSWEEGLQETPRARLPTSSKERHSFPHHVSSKSKSKLKSPHSSNFEISLSPVLASAHSLTYTTSSPMTYLNILPSPVQQVGSVRTRKPSENSNATTTMGKDKRAGKRRRVGSANTAGAGEKGKEKGGKAKKKEETQGQAQVQLKPRQRTYSTYGNGATSSFCGKFTSNLIRSKRSPPTPAMPQTVPVLSPEVFSSPPPVSRSSSSSFSHPYSQTYSSPPRASQPLKSSSTLPSTPTTATPNTAAVRFSHLPPTPTDGSPNLTLQNSPTTPPNWKKYAHLQKEVDVDKGKKEVKVNLMPPPPLPSPSTSSSSRGGSRMPIHPTAKRLTVVRRQSQPQQQVVQTLQQHEHHSPLQPQQSSVEQPVSELETMLGLLDKVSLFLKDDGQKGKAGLGLGTDGMISVVESLRRRVEGAVAGKGASA